MGERIETAVHGFGRIGMPYARLAIDDPDMAVRAIGGRQIDAHDIAERLILDSTHGRFEGHSIEHPDGQLVVDGASVALVDTAGLTPQTWSAVSSDMVVVDATGAYTNLEGVRKHHQAGAQSVVITSPVKDQRIPTVVRGVNDTEDMIEQVRRERMLAVSSCSTNCIAPILHHFAGVFPLESASAQVVHARTNSQPHLDGRGEATSSRRSADNIVAAGTGSATEVQRLVPGLQFYSNSFRVPVADGSLAVINLEVATRVTETDVQAVLAAIKEDPSLQEIIGTSEYGMFSGGVIGDSHSSVIDLNNVRVTRHSDRTSVELQAWFDNEWGYANRVKELAKIVGATAL